MFLLSELTGFSKAGFDCGNMEAQVLASSLFTFSLGLSFLLVYRGFFLYDSFFMLLIC